MNYIVEDNFGSKPRYFLTDQNRSEVTDEIEKIMADKVGEIVRRKTEDYQIQVNNLAYDLSNYSAMLEKIKDVLKDF